MARDSSIFRVREFYLFSNKRLFSLRKY